MKPVYYGHPMYKQVSLCTCIKPVSSTVSIAFGPVLVGHLFITATVGLPLGMATNL